VLSVAAVRRISFVGKLSSDIGTNLDFISFCDVVCCLEVYEEIVSLDVVLIAFFKGLAQFKELIRHCLQSTKHKYMFYIDLKLKII
jgi:hypothetical protein